MFLLIPSFIMRRSKLNEDIKWRINTFLSTILVVSVFYLFMPTSDGIKLLGMQIHGFCLFKTLLNIGCPVCGLTRSINSAIHFNILKSFYEHPLGLPILLLILIFVLYRVSAFTKLIPQLSFEKEFIVFKKVNLYFLYILILYWLIRISIL
jgi:hypothetical protein